MAKYNHKTVEAKWQQRWDKSKLYEMDFQNAKNPYYNLTMFPYPSAEALHVGHVYCYGGTDTFGRYMRLKGYDVFEPMGFDAFGIHSENYAIKIGQNPQVVVPRNIKHFRDDQMKKLGCMFDWSRQVDTTDPNYYKWTQWIFIQMHQAGLVERRQEAVDWCPSCQTVLANEQVVDGKCERCSTEVVQKDLEQWFFKITKYADRLLAGLDKIDWPERTKSLQRHWIGKKTGIDIRYRIDGNPDKFVTCFTTRPETNFGATFVVMAPEHEMVDAITTPEQKVAVAAYRDEVRKKTELERTEMAKVKTGVFTGSYCINDLTGQKMPIWLGDFVLRNFGTGVVVAVPAHDKRDFEFAQKFDLPVLRVLSKQGEMDAIQTVDDVWEDDGQAVNSGFLDGMTWDKAREAIMDHMEKNGWGKRTTSYRLHDWCISRQRYWGPPIPMIHCDEHGWVPVKVEDLPVKLPPIENYQPDGSGRGPLANVPEFVNTVCPTCGKPAKRETDVSDTFLDSAWYQLRYPSVDIFEGAGKVNDRPFDQVRNAKWQPVDMYIGGIEHATMHLLYFRFVTMVLHDLGHLNFDEPATRLRHQGLIIKDGSKMSKSRGNVVNPDEYLQKFGADAFRTYMLFIGPFEDGGDFNDRGIMGTVRFFDKVWDLLTSDRCHPELVSGSNPPGKGEERRRIEFGMTSKAGGVSMAKLHATIKKVGEDIEQFQFNTAIAALMEMSNWIRENLEQFSAKQWQQIQQIVPILVAPFAPHFAEETWALVGTDSVHNQAWPTFDPAQLVEDTGTIMVQINGKIRDQFVASKTISEADAKAMAFALPKVKQYLEGKEIIKVVFVAGKLLSVVVK